MTARNNSRGKLSEGTSVWVYRFIPDFFDLDRCMAELGWMDIPLPRQSKFPRSGDLVILAAEDGALHAIVEIETRLGKVKAPRQTQPYWRNRGYRKAIHPRVRGRFVDKDDIRGLDLAIADLSRLEKHPWFLLVKDDAKIHLTLSDTIELKTPDSNAQAVETCLDISDENESSGKVRSQEGEVVGLAMSSANDSGFRYSQVGNAGDHSVTTEKRDFPIPNGDENSPDNIIATKSSETQGQVLNEERCTPIGILNWGDVRRSVIMSFRGDEYLRALRAVQKLTQYEFALRIQSTQPMVSGWERGAASPSQHDWRSIQNAFGGVQLAGSQTGSVQMESGERFRQCRLILGHFSRFGELARCEDDWLGLTPEVVATWTASLVSIRPCDVLVATPLLLELIKDAPSPAGITTKIATSFLGEEVDRLVKQPVEAVEQYVWEHFGSWHLSQPHPGDAKWHGYIEVPANEPADRAASERLDLFSQLPPTIISELVREPDFLSEQQRWSAQAAGKTNLGVLSRQLKLGIRRPLFLSHFRLPELSVESLHVRDLPLSEVLDRQYVVSGMPLCLQDEWTNGVNLARDVIVGRMLDHPLHAMIVQLEVQRMMASLSGQVASTLRKTADGGCSVEVSGVDRGPLWKACRTLLVDIGYWPVGMSTADSFWFSAVQAALDNLITAGVMEMAGGGYRLTESFGSDLKAHPGHPQNRGEKPFRARLLQYLEGFQGGAR